MCLFRKQLFRKFAVKEGSPGKTGCCNILKRRLIFQNKKELTLLPRVPNNKRMQPMPFPRGHSLIQFQEEKHLNKIKALIKCTKIGNNDHCVKCVRIRSYSGPHFPAFGLNSERYGVSLLYSVQMRENADQNNSEYGHFSRIGRNGIFQFLFRKGNKKHYNVLLVYLHREK